MRSNNLWHHKEFLLTCYYCVNFDRSSLKSSTLFHRFSPSKNSTGHKNQTFLNNIQFRAMIASQFLHNHQRRDKVSVLEAVLSPGLSLFGLSSTNYPAPQSPVSLHFFSSSLPFFLSSLSAVTNRFNLSQPPTFSEAQPQIGCWPSNPPSLPPSPIVSILDLSPWCDVINWL